MVAYAQGGDVGSETGARIVTVAELLRRNIPAQRAPRAAGPSTAGEARYVSVGSLLRREGRAPHALDRPLQPRASRTEEEAAADEAVARTATRKRTAVAAAAMLTVGGILGAAILSDAASDSSAAQEGSGGSYPGRGLGADGTTAAGPPYLAAGLPAGVAAPTNWMNVAFDTPLAAGALAPGAATGGQSAGTPVVGAPGSGAPGSGAPGSGAGASAGTTVPGATPADGPPAPPASPVGQAVRATTGTVGNGLADAGNGTPLAPLTQPVGRAVTGAGQGLAETADATLETGKQVLAPVTGPVGQVVDQVLPAAAPLTGALAPAKPAPADQALTDTVTEGASAVLTGVNRTAGGLVHGLVG